MGNLFTITLYDGPVVPERWSAAEQQAIRKATGAVPQRPGIPGPVVSDPDGRPVLAISRYSAVRPDPASRGLLSTAEVLEPAPAGASWPASGRIEHPGIGWTTYRYEDLEGGLRGEGIASVGRGSVWGQWEGAVVRSGEHAWTLDDIIRPESDDERARRERRWFPRSERRLGERVLGHRFVPADGTESGQLTWSGDHQPDHHEHPYTWHLEWDTHPDDCVLVAAMASALRFMAHVGSMLSTS